MPDLKVYLGDDLLVSTPVNCKKASQQSRSVSFGPNQVHIIDNRRIRTSDLQKVTNPVKGQNYYYIKDKKIKHGKYEQFDTALKSPHIIEKDDKTENSMFDFVDSVYTDNNARGIKTRKYRNFRKSRKSRKTNRRKRSKKRKYK